jgi:tetratricopeptide (TPR) repeat protein
MPYVSILMVANGSGRHMLPARGGIRRAGLALTLCAGFACGFCHAQDRVADLAARAEHLEEQGQFEQAAAAYRQILQIDPHSIAAFNRLGALSVRQNKFEEGIHYYRQALALNPYEFGTNLNLGIAYIKMQDYGHAAHPLGVATESEPGDFQARELLGVALVGEDDYARAIPQLEAASRLNPQDAATVYLLDRAYLENKQYAQALATFDKLKSLDPGSPWLNTLQGQAYDGLGNYNQAIAEFEAARQQLPGDATVRFSLGFMYWKVRRYPEAEGELQQALDLDPHFDEARFYLADTYLMNQQPAKALPMLEALATEQPQNTRVLVDQGKALERLSRSEDAVRAYQAALKIDPQRSDAHYQLAQVYKKLGRVTESQQELALAQKLQGEKRQEEETLLNASGARGNPAVQFGPAGASSQPRSAPQ